MLEEDRLPPGLLKELGTDRQALREFVRQYRQESNPVEPSTGPEKPGEPGAGQEGGQVMAARTAAAEGMAARDALPTKPEKDALRSRFEGSADRLSPRYKEVVDRYYKVLSEER